jgi:hypothetical protein
MPKSKKAAKSSLMNSSLSSSTIPTLASPTRGFGLQPDTVEQESSLQEEQPQSEQSSELPPTHDISRISLRRSQVENATTPSETPYGHQPHWVTQRLMRMVAPQPVISPEESHTDDQDDIVQTKCATCEAEEQEEDSQTESLPVQREELRAEEENLQMKSLANSTPPLVQPEELPATQETNISQVQPAYKPLSHDISRISLHRPQAKLKINQPGDIYEQEADRVAQQVMRKLSEPVNLQSQPQEELPAPPADNLQMKSLADTVTPVVQRKGGGEMAATPDIETSIQESRGGGESMSDDIRQPMEQAFGADFSSVKIHSDSRSDQLNQSIQARAFTTGQDIFFRQGEYTPGSNAGKELLAHELTHVIQQKGNSIQPQADVQRVCSECEQEQENSEQLLQAKELPGSTPQLPGDVSALNNQSQQTTEPAAESLENENADVSEELTQGNSNQDTVSEQSPSDTGGVEPPPDDDPQAQAEVLEKMRLAKEEGADLENPESENSVEIAAPQDQPSTEGEKTAEQENGEDEPSPKNQPLKAANTEVEDTKTEDEPSPENQPLKAAEAEVEDTKKEDKEDQKAEGSENIPPETAEEATNQNPQNPETPVNQGEQTPTQPSTEPGNDVTAQGVETPAPAQTPPTEQLNPQNPEAITAAVTPETVAEKEDATAEAVESQVQQNVISNGTAALVSSGINFAPPEQEGVEQGEDDTDFAQEQAAAASSVANNFFAEAAVRVQKITEIGQGISPRIQEGAENAKALVTAQVAQQKTAVSTQIAQQREQTQAEAQAAIAHIKSQYDAGVAATTQLVATNKQKIETEHATALQKVDEQERNQLAKVEEAYNRTVEQVRAAGVKVGDDAIAFGEQKATAWESQIKGEDDNFWDGPLTDNRLKARAKAAREVAGQYKTGLIEEANKQADKVPEGKPKDIENVHSIAKQSREQLQTLQKQSLQNLTEVEQKVLTQLADAQTQLTQAANQTQQDTLQTLNQQEAAQLQLLEGYAQGQIAAIDRDTQKAIASLQNGVNEAATNLQTTLQETQSQLQDTPAPNPDELSPVLAEILAQFDNAVAIAQEKTEQGITASAQGISQGGQQVVGAVSAMAQKGLEESAIVTQDAKTSLTNLKQGATDTFSQIQQTLTTVVTQTTDAAVQGFNEATQGSQTAFDKYNETLETSLQKSVKDLEDGLKGAIQGGKEPTLETDIQKYADEAAAKEEPRGVSFFKTLAKVLLVVAVIAVAIVFAPAVIGAVGAAAAALGASAAIAGGIGAIVGGAIVGAIAGAVIQMGNNLIDGKNLLDGVGKAMLAGAIGGALGGLGGLAGNALAQAGKLGTGLTQLAGRVGIDVAFDIAGGIFGNLATGQPITVEGILIGAAIAGGVGAAVSKEALGKLGKLGRGIESMQTRNFQAGERFGRGAVDTFRGTGSKVDTPTVGSPDVKAPETSLPRGTSPEPQTQLPRGTSPEVDTPTGAKTDTELPGVKSQQTDVKVPQETVGGDRTTHMDEPEIEPGVVAKQTAADGHEIKVLKDGRVVRCSDCEPMNVPKETANTSNSKEKLEQATKQYDAENEYKMDWENPNDILKLLKLADEGIPEAGPSTSPSRANQQVGDEILPASPTVPRKEVWDEILPPDSPVTAGKKPEQTATDQSPSTSPTSSLKSRFANLLTRLRGLGGSKYKTIGMLKSFAATDKLNSVDYLKTAQERLQYKVQFENGKLLKSDGSPLHTLDSSAHGAKGYVMYVMDKDGNIYTAGSDQVQHHSSFMAGRPVASAGEIKVENGVIKEIIDQSGHYAPTKGKTKQFETELKKNNVDLGEVQKNYRYFTTRKQREKAGFEFARLGEEAVTSSNTKSDVDTGTSRGLKPENEISTTTREQEDIAVAGPSGRTTHMDEPEIEPGIVAKASASDGHDIKIPKSGKIYKCSDCAEIRQRYADLLQQKPELKQRLDEIEAIKDPNEKADAAAKFEAELSQMGLARQGEQILNAVNSRIASQSDKFELTYTKDQLDSIIKKGKELGLSDKVIEDLIYTGSRKAKAITADELVGQMEHWANVIKERGYPEKFSSKEEFQEFSQDLLKGVRQAGIPADDIRIQGSSLRKTTAQDVDIAAFVDEPAFDRLLIDRYHDKITIKENNTKVSLADKSHEELVQLANDIAANPTKYNAQGKTFQNALLNGIISSKSDIVKPLKQTTKTINEKYPHLNVESISVLIRGGRFDVKPDLPVTGN